MKLHCLYLMLRRIAAFLYDCLLLLALFFLITAIAIFHNDGQAIESVAYKLMLILIAGLFFCGFWKNGGQTLGMRAWRIKLVNNESLSLSWKECVVRYATGVLLFGITLVYALFNQQCLTLHDRISGTRVIRDIPLK